MAPPYPNDDHDDTASTVEADNYFAIVPEWIIFHKALDGHSVRLYCVLQRYANKQDEAWPSLKTIAGLMGDVSTKTVQRCIAALVEIGAVEVRPRHRDDGSRTSNRYLVRSRVDTGVQGGGTDVGGRRPGCPDMNHSHGTRATDPDENGRAASSKRAHSEGRETYANGTAYRLLVEAIARGDAPPMDKARAAGNAAFIAYVYGHDAAAIGRFLDEMQWGDWRGSDGYRIELCERLGLDHDMTTDILATLREDRERNEADA